MWNNKQYDELLQEAVHCNQSLHNTHRSSARNKTDHIVRVFTKLMLEGNARAAVHWVTERAGGGLLQPTDTVDYNHPQFGVVSKTVLDALRLKHPDPSVPPTSVLPSFDNLPYLEDVEITGAHIQSVAHQFQSGVGPGGCDASHRRDILLQFGASSTRLHDTVAAVCCRLCNTITPWEDIQALIACRLIALNKCPGVRPIGIGETLHRVIGKTICLSTRIDATMVCGSDQLCAGLS